MPQLPVKVICDLEDWFPVDLGPEGATHESKREECISSQQGLLPLTCRGDTEILVSLAEMWFQATDMQRRRPLSPPWLRQLCPSPFLPMLQSPQSLPKYTDGHQPPSASYRCLTPVSPKHKLPPPAFFHPSTLCRPWASGEPREFEEGATRRTQEHPMHGECRDELRTPVLYLQPHRAFPICAATLRKRVFCKPPGQVPAPFPLKARSRM